jgi:hypothetical protein
MRRNIRNERTMSINSSDKIAEIMLKKLEFKDASNTYRPAVITLGIKSMQYISLGLIGYQ